MIKIEKQEVLGWDHAIRGMRNPLNSWPKSDSGWEGDRMADGVGIVPYSNGENVLMYGDEYSFILGQNDADLMARLRNAGTDHRKFMRMIIVYFDVTAPLYWWKEYDTYKVGTVANSCSTMHKIHEKEFTWDDFSCEHLTNYGAWVGEHGFMEESASYAHAKIMDLVIDSLNGARVRYLDYVSRGPEYKDRAKQVWWQMIQLLPTSYNQKRTLSLNYEVLANIYHSRAAHKLDEWVEFCKWIETLPYSELITGTKGE